MTAPVRDIERCGPDELLAEPDGAVLRFYTDATDAFEGSERTVEACTHVVLEFAGETFVLRDRTAKELMGAADEWLAKGGSDGA